MEERNFRAFEREQQAKTAAANAARQRRSDASRGGHGRGGPAGLLTSPRTCPPSQDSADEEEREFIGPHLPGVRRGGRGGRGGQGHGLGARRNAATSNLREGTRILKISSIQF
jgi:hypothetical protein